jgi:hypothetical protein
MDTMMIHHVDKIKMERDYQGKTGSHVLTFKTKKKDGQEVWFHLFSDSRLEIEEE